MLAHRVNEAGGPVQSPARQFQPEGVLHPRTTHLIDTWYAYDACASDAVGTAASELRIT